jgi:hypothetical protein
MDIFLSDSDVLLFLLTKQLPENQYMKAPKHPLSKKFLWLSAVHFAQTSSVLQDSTGMSMATTVWPCLPPPSHPHPPMIRCFNQLWPKTSGRSLCHYQTAWSCGSYSLPTKVKVWVAHSLINMGMEVVTSLKFGIPVYFRIFFQSS